jgi:hypothetical protein
MLMSGGRRTGSKGECNGRDARNGTGQDRTGKTRHGERAGTAAEGAAWRASEGRGSGEASSSETQDSFRAGRDGMAVTESGLSPSLKRAWRARPRTARRHWLGPAI